MKKGFTLTELIFVISIIVVLLITFLNLERRPQDKACQSSCKSNLKQLGTSMRLYLDSKGKNCHYPADNGSTFLVRLYISQVISESGIFLCPSTGDDNDKGGLLTSTNYTVVGEVGGNYSSYAGRNNSNQNVYPGIFTRKNSSLTSMGSDDFGDPQRQGSIPYNHPDGPVVVFVDGHSAHLDLDEVAKLSTMIDPLGN